MDEYNAKSSRQARFIEQEQENKKKELIDISIQHQILSPFTAFVAIETRNGHETIAEASSSEMILREVPIEIRPNRSRWDNPPGPISTLSMLATNDFDAYMSRELDTRHRDDTDYLSFLVPLTTEEQSIKNYDWNTCSNLELCSSCCYVQSQSRSRSRSRSPSRSLSLWDYDSVEAESESDINDQVDMIRQIIDLQNFNGLWSMKNYQEVTTLLQKSAIPNNVDMEKIFNEFQHNDNDLVLSMILMILFMKYFTDDEYLWKPIMKKCSKAIEDQLGNNVYAEMTSKMKSLI